ncbi:MAG: hypothetical protein KDC98_26600 [Planctomycetes bacterium]|nr:hypothetical protein [Planctomycetota bacterium]
MNRSIRIDIDRLVLHGIDGIERDALEASIRRELTALLQPEREIADAAGDAAAVSPSSSPSSSGRLGAEIARAVYRRIDRP